MKIAHSTARNAGRAAIALAVTIAMGAAAVSAAAVAPSPSVSPSPAPSAEPSPTPSAAPSPAPAQTPPPEQVVAPARGTDQPSGTAFAPAGAEIDRAEYATLDNFGDGSIASDGTIVQVIGTVSVVADLDVGLVHLDGGGYLNLTKATVADLVATRHVLTLDVSPEMAAAVADAASLPATDADIARSGAPGIADPQFAVLSGADGPFDVIGATALEADVNPALASTYYENVWIVAQSLDHGSKWYTPRNAKNQDKKPATAALKAAAGYWSKMSGGSIVFSRAGYVPWDKSTLICDPDSNFAAIATLGETRAATESDYVADTGNHVVMVLPPNHDCFGHQGYADQGNTIDFGGFALVLGSKSAKSKAIWKHMLGHNMGYGHANTLSFASGAPSIFTNLTGTGTEYDQENFFDVMSWALNGYAGGTMTGSTGYFSGSDYQFVYVGTNDYTLPVMSSDKPNRIAYPYDTTGDEYFYVEARSFTGRDAGLKGKLGAAAGPSLGKGVLITQADLDDGFESWVLAPEGDPSKAYYSLGDVFTSTSGDVVVEVLTVSDSNATVRITMDGPITVGTVSIDGQQGVTGTILTAVPAGWDSDSWGSTFTHSYTWLRDGKPIASGPNYIPTLADAGHKISVEVVSYVAGHYGTRGRASSAQGPTIVKPSFVTEPVGITGTAAVGGTLSAVTPVWDVPLLDVQPAVTLAYQWYRGSKKISGATSVDYDLVAKDVGKRLSVKVTQSAAGVPSASKKSAQTAKVNKGTFTGTFEVLGVSWLEPVAISVVVGGPAEPDIDFSYRWYRDGKKLKKPRGDTYAFSSKDAGKTVTARVTATKAGYNSQVLDYEIPSWQFEMYADPIERTISGDLALGSAITVDTPVYELAGFDGTPDSTTYQWYRGSKKISGATSDEYTIVNADLGKRLWVKVTGHKNTWLDTVTKSPKTEVVRANAILGDLSTAAFTDGTVNPRLEVVGVGIDELGVTYKYQWYANGKAVKGATGAFFQTKQKHWGKDIKARVTVKKSGYTSEVAYSDSFAVSVFVTNDASLTEYEPRVGDTISVNLADYDPDTALHGFQWYRDGKKIAGQDFDNYTVTASDKGKRISVKVYGINAGYITNITTLKTTKDVRKAL